jgi:hypothetical protein
MDLPLVWTMVETEQDQLPVSFSSPRELGVLAVVHSSALFFLFLPLGLRAIRRNMAA